MAKATNTKGARQKRNMSEAQLNNLKGKKKPEVTELDPEDTPERRTRRDWEQNNEMIHSAYTELLLQKQKPPSFAEISRKTKLSLSSVERHMANYDFEAVKQKFRMGNQAVYMNMYKQAATSKNPKWVEIWLKWNGDLTDKVDITTNGKDINRATALEQLTEAQALDILSKRSSV
jgi:hypothetical protein